MALKELRKLVDKFSITIVPFYCGGSFTIDATAISSEEMEFSVLTKEAAQKTDVHAAVRYHVIW